MLLFSLFSLSTQSNFTEPILLNGRYSSNKNLFFDVRNIHMQILLFNESSNNFANISYIKRNHGFPKGIVTARFFFINSTFGEMIFIYYLPSRKKLISIEKTFSNIFVNYSLSNISEAHLHLHNNLTQNMKSHSILIIKHDGMAKGSIVNQYRSGYSELFYLKAIKSQYQIYNIRWRIMTSLFAFSTSIFYFLWRAYYQTPPNSGNISPIAAAFLYSGDMYESTNFYYAETNFSLTDTYLFLSLYIIFVTFASYYEKIRFFDDSVERHNIGSSRHYIYALVFIFLFFSQFNPYFFLCIRFSYWIPQIVFSAYNNKKKTVKSWFAFSMTLTQWLLFYSVQNFIYIDNNFTNQYYTTSKILCLFFWSLIQVFMIFLQNQFGGAFFLPHSLRRETDQFEFKNEVPPENTECPICLSVFDAGEVAIETPCHHYFHKECLGPWIETNQTCPVCRATLPESFD